jgi:hypothetical protein
MDTNMELFSKKRRGAGVIGSIKNMQMLSRASNQKVNKFSAGSKSWHNDAPSTNPFSTKVLRGAICIFLRYYS